jgi:hypothetical protein
MPSDLHLDGPVSRDLLAIMAGHGIFAGLSYPPGQTTGRRPLAVFCAHEGRPAPPPPNGDRRKAYYHCEAGKGIVSRCDCGEKCDRFVKEEREVEAGTRPPPPLPAKRADLPIGRRHLVMHVYPSCGNNTWRRSLDQIRIRLPLFTGHKAIAAVTAPDLHPWEDVRDYCRDMDADVFPVPNDPNLREVATWEPLWERVLAKADDADAAFYCHAKGATRAVDPGNMTHRWASLQWSLNLDWWAEMESLLKRRPIVGCFKKLGYGFGRQEGRFHYSGTFFWVRVGDFRTKRYPLRPNHWKYAVEAWPGRAYDPGEAGCFYRETPASKTDLYCPEKWRTEIWPEYQRWVTTKLASSPAATGSVTAA